MSAVETVRVIQLAPGERVRLEVTVPSLDELAQLGPELAHLGPAPIVLSVVGALRALGQLPGATPDTSHLIAVEISPELRFIELRVDEPGQVQVWHDYLHAGPHAPITTGGGGRRHTFYIHRTQLLPDLGDVSVNVFWQGEHAVALAADEARDQAVSP